MDNLKEIKEKLDAIHQEYKNNKSQLNGEKTRMAAKLIVEMTFSNEVNPTDIALELSRFSADIVNIYFESLTKSATIPLEMLDEVLKEFLLITDRNVKKSQHYVQKFVFAITSIMKIYKEKALKSKQLPRLTIFIARFAVKSDMHRKKFQTLINNTMGGIFMLDYSNIKKNSLVNIWNATNSVFPDLSKAKYESFIIEWGKKYGFIEDIAVETPVKQDNSVKIEKVIVSNEAPAESVKQTEKQDTATVNDTVTTANSESDASSRDNTNKEDKETQVAPKEETMTTDDTATTVPEKAMKKAYATPTPEKELPSEKAVKKLYISIKRDMDKEQEAIITAFTDMITPIGKAFESIQGEISKSREIGAENVLLKAKIEDLERQLSEQRSKLQDVNHSLMTAKTENDELKKQISVLESQNSELDSKLNDAYTINSRESSLEAEKIRSELKKAFAFLYEDWLEYEFSDVSEDNYESLQAIIKKIFRSLERNGIDFKEKN